MDTRQDMRVSIFTMASRCGDGILLCALFRVRLTPIRCIGLPPTIPTAPACGTTRRRARTGAGVRSTGHMAGMSAAPPTIPRRKLGAGVTAPRKDTKGWGRSVVGRGGQWTRVRGRIPMAVEPLAASRLPKAEKRLQPAAVKDRALLGSRRPATSMRESTGMDTSATRRPGSGTGIMAEHGSR